MKTKKDEKLETLSLGRIEDLIRQIFTEIIKSIRKLKMKALKQNKYLHVEKITPNYKYGFRAECEYDIIKFQNNLMSNELYKYNGWNFNYSRNSIFPDVDCELEIDLEIAQVRKIMRLQTDSHVMIQSINDYENYTGERDYTID